MFEHKKQPLASPKKFLIRFGRHLLYTLIFILGGLGIGVLGYHYTDHIPWIDAFHNASMILSGMGPVVNITSTGGKWFSSLYALFSGIAFITNMGILLAPIAHRIFHQLHMEDNENTL